MKPVYKDYKDFIKILKAVFTRRWSLGAEYGCVLMKENVQEKQTDKKWYFQGNGSYKWLLRQAWITLFKVLSIDLKPCQCMCSSN